MHQKSTRKDRLHNNFQLLIGPDPTSSGGSRIFPKGMPNEKKSHVFQINPFINLVNIIIKFTTQFDI
jgi:hypothetical protein